jgi:hypothetical protein
MVKIVRWVKMAVLAAAMSVGTAHAAFINGSLAGSDGGLTLPVLPSTSIVSQMNTITQGSPVGANNCTGDFGNSANCFGFTLSTSTIDILAETGTYQWNGFTFTITSIAPADVVRNALHGAVGSSVLLSDSLRFEFDGTVAGGGFDTTAFHSLWVATGSCGGSNPPATCKSNATASWAVSLTALGQSVVPEPGTLALIGIALLGMGFIQRRPQA